MGYRIYYREYPSNETWLTEEIPVSSEHKEKEQYVLSKLTRLVFFGVYG